MFYNISKYTWILIYFSWNLTKTYRPIEPNHQIPSCTETRGLYSLYNVYLPWILYSQKMRTSSFLYFLKYHNFIEKQRCQDLEVIMIICSQLSIVQYLQTDIFTSSMISTNHSAMEVLNLQSNLGLNTGCIVATSLTLQTCLLRIGVDG